MGLLGKCTKLLSKWLKQQINSRNTQTHNIFNRKIVRFQNASKQVGSD